MIPPGSGPARAHSADARSAPARSRARRGSRRSLRGWLRTAPRALRSAGWPAPHSALGVGHLRPSAFEQCAERLRILLPCFTDAALHHPSCSTNARPLRPSRRSGGTRRHHPVPARESVTSSHQLSPKLSARDSSSGVG